MRVALRGCKRQGKECVPEPPEAIQLCQHPDCSPVKPVLDFYLWNCKIIHLCCSIPLSLWKCVIAKIRNQYNKFLSCLYV